MPDPLHLFIGDVHAGSSVAVMEPFSDHDGIQYGPSRVQSLLLKFWRQMVAEVKTAAKGRDLVLHLGGDLVDGVHHHGSTQTVGDVADQRALAVQLLLPLANISKMIYALLGTDAHVGQSGTEDASVAKELGAEARYRWRLDCSGKILDWAHHVAGPRLPWTQEGGLIRLTNKTIIDCMERDQKPPDLIVRHHTHLHCRTHIKGVDALVVPGWQAATAFTRKIDPSGLLTVGAVLWYPKLGEFRALLYRFPDDEITKARYAR